MKSKPLACVVCGSCVIDLLCKPVDLNVPIGGGVLIESDPIQLCGGGITINAGATLARLGIDVGVLSYVGSDSWGPILRAMLQKESIDDTLLFEHPTAATSTTMVAIDPTGERSFFHCVGAPKLLTAQVIEDHMDQLRQLQFFLIGYYSLMPNLEADLPALFAAMRKRGCKTAMDCAGSGGGMSPLDRILPHLDVYIPSLSEAEHQTGLTDPQKMIEVYRKLGSPGIVGIKLGTDGILLSAGADDYTHIDIVSPPGPVVDTTGAGDSFYAGFLAGLIKGLSVEQAGKLGAAAAACCVSCIGGSTGGQDYPTTARIAGLSV